MTYRAVVVDLDGTVSSGGTLLPGTPAGLRALRDADLEVLFVTNNPTRSPAAVAASLAEQGHDVAPDAVLTAGAVTREYLTDRHAGAAVFLVGEAGLREQLTGATVDLVADPRAADVLVASIDREFTYETLTDGLRALRAGATFVGTDPDRTVPAGDEVIPGSGAIVGAIAAAAGRDPDVMLGKPTPETARVVRERLRADPAETLVVGDRLDTDVALARELGADAALVLSGIASRADLADAALSPEHVLDSLADVADLL